MKHRGTFLLLIILVSTGLSGILLISCKDQNMKGMIILTQSAEKMHDVNYITGESWRFIPQARIVALDRDRPGRSLKVLSEGFYSACGPDVSYDCKYMLFAGKRKEGDPWQIWEMKLEDLKVRQITSSEDNCIDPVYLPGNRFVFSMITAGDSLMAGHSLFNGNIDGSDIRRITFNPNAYFAPNILRDGRVLTISRQLYPDPEDPLWIVMRPDGTKADMFYETAGNNTLFGRAWETSDGRLVFAESDSMNPERGNLISISYNRPLHTRINLTNGMAGDFRAVFPEPSGKLMVSCRKSAADRYALYEFDPLNKTLGEAVYADPGFDVIEVIVAEEHVKPKKLPSEVDTGVKSGLLLCQNINVLDNKTLSKMSSDGKAKRIEVLGLNSSLGIVDVEEDGSFYLKAMADTPFRIQTLDENGKVLNGPCSWIWLRPNERRGCIGCHEDHELAPENAVPLSVRKDPVIIPVHITEVTEKEVELE